MNINIIITEEGNDEESEAMWLCLSPFCCSGGSLLKYEIIAYLCSLTDFYRDKSA